MAKRKTPELVVLDTVRSHETADQIEKSWGMLYWLAQGIEDDELRASILSDVETLCAALVAFREERRRLVGLAQANLQAKMKEVHG